MPYPRFTKAIIQHFILKDKTISMRNNLFMHGVKNDSVLGFMKFVSKYEIRQVYGKLIPDVLVPKEMMESKAYKTYLDFAIGKVIPKEARNRTKARIKVTYLTADDNIISEDPDTALELAKSISRTEVEEQEAARLVHETHERLVTKQLTRIIRKTSVTIRDNTTVTKKKTPEQSLKLKGMEMLSDAVIHEEDTRKVIKASKLDLRSQNHTGGSSEGASSKPEVPDESKGKTKDTNKGAGSKPEGDSEDDDNDHKSDDERTESDDNKSIDLNEIDDEEEDQGDEFVHTPDDYVPTNDETHDVDNEEYFHFKTQQSRNQTQFLSTTDRSICNLFDTTMTTLADKSLLSGGDNKPPMLEKHLYDSWKSRMELYMMNRPHGRMILASVEKGPLVWPSITEDGVTRLKEYVELTPAEAIQADCDIKAINIILQGLPTEIYALVSQHRVAKDLWEKIKLLMQGTSLTKQERECKLYDEFDKFTYKKGETLHEYYLRFTLLLNDMNIYKMPLEQFQVNTKFLNTLPDEWSKFVTDVKLVKDLHTTNVDQLHAYLQQHERHANEVRLMHERNSDPLALVASHQLTQPAYQSHLHTHPKSLSQLHVSPYQSSQFGIQTTYAAGTTRKYTPRASGSNTGKQRTVICYNCKGEGHIAKQCTKPKRKRDETWFNDKVLLVQAQASGQALTEEEIAFLADPGLPGSILVALVFCC
ncbi:retrovirus-related pol polyprotein from transposon TNT 1-94, partial [Tanacetum coccineum]